jgi:hypothetical protein
MGVREGVQAGFQLIWTTAQKNVEAMPDAGMEFTPPGLDTRSFRAIAVHMANATVTFGENIGKDVWERIAAYPMDKPMSKAQVLEAMRDAGQRFLAGLTRLTDEEAGRVQAAPARHGDVVLARKDVPTSYHLSVTVDDALQGVTLVTRGVDLFAATDIHRLLQALLGLPTPRYAHHHLLTDAAGRRLAKRDAALTLRAMRQAGRSPAEVRAMAGFPD